MIRRTLIALALTAAALLSGGATAAACGDDIASHNHISPSVTVGPVANDVADVSTCGGVAQVGVGSDDEQTCDN